MAVGSLAQNNVFLPRVYERGEGGEQPEVANTNIHTESVLTACDGL